MTRQPIASPGMVAPLGASAAAPSILAPAPQSLPQGGAVLLGFDSAAIRPQAEAIATWFGARVVPAAAIAEEACGQTRPAVPTGDDGSLEASRRVVIELAR